MKRLIENAQYLIIFGGILFIGFMFYLMFKQFLIGDFSDYMLRVIPGIFGGLAVIFARNWKEKH